ncbi:hypothetical protein AB0D86_18100 [Streptomyces sp. NPDC048324]|uniref:hypothetical protein n=1 Tax=Streptomyces sp. NPDC048324 TaxID=3157205 RepID=UPI00341858A4
MNDFGDAHLRMWTLHITALLAADAQDQLAWLGNRDWDTGSVVEELELLCRVSEELTERGYFEPENQRHLQALGRSLAEIDTTRRAGLWNEALTTDPAWSDIRTHARQFLLTTLGDWHQPLPRHFPSHTGHR